MYYQTSKHPLSPPSLDELAEALTPALKQNYAESSVSVVDCPDLRQSPFFLAAEGLSGNEVVADIGGQAHLFPRPLKDKKYSMIECAQQMEMSASRGSILGAGAGPFHVVGKNTELSPNFSWQDGFDRVHNLTRYTEASEIANGEAKVACRPCPSTDCALMMNLFGSSGLPGRVLKITARARRGEGKSFHEYVQSTLRDKYGDQRQISIGGVFVIKSGRAFFHVMPDFPPDDELPFADRKQLEKWLTYHHFEAPIVCLTVFHTADAEELGLRMEHTHCFSATGEGKGGHYHYDILEGDGSESDEIEYEAYFNTAQTLYRIDRPQ